MTVSNKAPQASSYKAESNRRGTQRDRILQLLRDANGDWVSLPAILSLGCAQYSVRIFELRRQGHAIQNRTKVIDGRRHSWFRLGTGQGALFPS